VVVLLLALVFLHLADEGWEAAANLGAICFALVAVLGPTVVERMRHRLSPPRTSVRGDRGPPRPHLSEILATAARATDTRSLPLRR